MKVYIASSLSNWRTVRHFSKQLLKHNIITTFDWTVHAEEIETSLGRGHTDDDLRCEMAGKEIEGLEKADVIVAIMPGGLGTHFEIGYAYKSKKPIILVDRESSDYKVAFHHLIELKHVKDTETAINLLTQVSFVSGTLGEDPRQ